MRRSWGWIRPLTVVVTSSAAIAAVLVGCGSSARPRTEDDIDAAASAEPAPSASASAVAVEVDPVVPDGSIARSRMDGALRRGPGWLFRQVAVEDVIRQNKFVGWRVNRMPAAWETSGLHAGDIVLKVNGAALETDDALFDTYVKLTEASELRIAYEREGKSGECVIPIVGAPNPDTRHALDQGDAPPQGKPTRVRTEPKRQGTNTIIIGGDSRPDDE